MIFSSMSKSLGFLVFVLSEVPPIRSFGLLSLAAMLLALFADLVLLPSLLSYWFQNTSGESENAR